ncbi:MAG: polyphosphate kinase 2 family protein [Candidatus Dormibacteraeota bacterium]|nr:polyphosphate kinase 2 family protein [Candidatus Dormibacteraeota bacterium]
MARTAPLSEQLGVRAGVPGFQLAAVDPAATFGLKKKRVLEQIGESRPELLDLQTRLYAESRRSLLVVLQGMDTSGKDGTIKHVIGHFNPVDVRITSFKEPTPEERRHGFLWRVRKALPGPGQVGIFNRSHYEDVLVARVDGVVPPAVIEKRYEEIRKFEGELQKGGTTVLKFCLHISWEEQRQRLHDRLKRPDKVWKFSEHDLEVRANWDRYMAAYSAALLNCSDPVPWHVIPADHKWVRDWAVTQLLLDRLRGMDLKYPPPKVDVKAMKARLKADVHVTQG